MSSALLGELLPGPVTVVFERTLQLNNELNPGTTLVGIRVPNHGFVRDLSRACGEPLALTSANPSAAGSTLSVQVRRVIRLVTDFPLSVALQEQNQVHCQSQRLVVFLLELSLEWRQNRVFNLQEFEGLWQHLACVYDGGVLGSTAQSRLGSTVVDLSKTGFFTVIRPGR